MIGDPAMHLADLRWPDLVDDAPVLVVPLGSTEQHGPHLPLDADSRIAEEVAARLARVVPGLAVSRCVGIGASGEHDGFPGTLSVGTEVFENMVVEIGRSADRFAGVVWVNAHGGNSAALQRAHERLIAEGRRSLVVRCSVVGGDAHAGRTETSILLAIDPAAVDLDRAEVGLLTPWSDVAEAIRLGGVRAVSANGVLGDPTGATAAEGEQLLAGMVDRAVAVVARWVDDQPC